MKSIVVKLYPVFAILFMISAFCMAGASDYADIHHTDFNWFTIIPVVGFGAMTVWGMYLKKNDRKW